MMHAARWRGPCKPNPADRANEPRASGYGRGKVQSGRMEREARGSSLPSSGEPETCQQHDAAQTAMGLSWGPLPYSSYRVLGYLIRQVSISDRLATLRRRRVYVRAS